MKIERLLSDRLIGMFDKDDRSWLPSVERSVTGSLPASSELLVSAFSSDMVVLHARGFSDQ